MRMAFFDPSIDCSTPKEKRKYSNRDSRRLQYAIASGKLEIILWNDVKKELQDSVKSFFSDGDILDRNAVCELWNVEKDMEDNLLDSEDGSETPGKQPFVVDDEYLTTGKMGCFYRARASSCTLSRPVGSNVQQGHAEVDCRDRIGFGGRSQVKRFH